VDKNAPAAAAVPVIVAAVVVAPSLVVLLVVVLLVVAVASEEADAIALDELVASTEALDVLDEMSVVLPLEDESVVGLHAASEPARVRAATEEAKRTQNWRAAEGAEVVIKRVKSPTLSQM
jgi:hypothetical protein